MSKDKKSDKDEFGLNEPTGHFDSLDKEMKRRPAAREKALDRPARFISAQAGSPRPTGWKGFEQEVEEEFEKDVEFAQEKIPVDELDMTPMVDVTFLLLIFFMVTASFTLQKSLEQPHSESKDPSSEVIQDEDMIDDYVQVTIDQTNTFYVTTENYDEVECPSDSEMRARVKNAKETTGANRMVVVAHVDSTHAKVIAAWDAGLITGMEQIEIQTTEEDY